MVGEGPFVVTSVCSRKSLSLAVDVDRLSKSSKISLISM